MLCHQNLLSLKAKLYQNYNRKRNQTLLHLQKEIFFTFHVTTNWPGSPPPPPIIVGIPPGSGYKKLNFYYSFGLHV